MNTIQESGVYESQSKSFVLLVTITNEEIRTRVNEIITSAVNKTHKSGILEKCLFPIDLHKACFPEKWTRKNKKR